VLGAVAAEAGLPALELGRVVGYDDVQTVLAAGLKLLPLDPADATAWCVELLPDVDRLAHEVSTLTAATDIPATGSPQIEGWAQAHARTTRRLFSA
jgi:urease accessory protein